MKVHEPIYTCERCEKRFWRKKRGERPAPRFCGHACANKVVCKERKRATREALFLSYVIRGDGCWLWQGRLDADGYGRMKYDGKYYRAHRLSYELTYGQPPDSLYVCHTCDNPRCVRPDHLWLGTAKDNFDDSYAKGRSTPQKKGRKVMDDLPTDGPGDPIPGDIGYGD